MISKRPSNLSTLCLISAVAFVSSHVLAQRNPTAGKHEEVRIWPGAAPGSENVAQTESSMPYPLNPQNRIVRNVTIPTLTVFRPDKQIDTGTSIIFAPGGGFTFLSFDDEGTQEAEHFAAMGVTAFILKYRVAQTPAKDEDFIPTQPSLGPDSPQTRMAIWKRATVRWPKKTPEEFERLEASGAADGVQAIKYIRAHAADFHIAPDKIVFAGFSAGAGVSANVLLQSDPALRPNYSIMIYGPPFSPTASSIPANLPPIFMAYAADDPIVGEAVEHFREALYVVKVHPEIHEFTAGSHGFAMKHQGTTSDHWLQELEWWMKSQKLLSIY